MPNTTFQPEPIELSIQPEATFGVIIPAGPVEAFLFGQGIIGDPQDSGSIVASGAAGPLAGLSACKLDLDLKRLFAIDLRAVEVGQALLKILANEVNFNILTEIQAACQIIPDLTALENALIDITDLGPVIRSPFFNELLCDQAREFSDLDPKMRLNVLNRRMRNKIRCLSAEFEDAVRDATSRKVIKLGSQFLEELRLLGFPSTEANLVLCILDAMKTNFPGLLDVPGTSLAQFENAIQGLDINNLIPADLPSPASEIISAIVDCDIRLQQWKDARVIRL